MLSLLSRTARTRGSCHCPQCLHSVRETAKQAGTGGSVLRPQYWTSSTLWYSGIFAAAATYDAGAKIQRRQQWKDAIDEVKKELGHAASHAENEQDKYREVDPDEQPGRVPLRHDGSDARQMRAGNAVDSKATLSASTEMAEDFDSDLARNLDSSSSRIYVPPWPTTTGDPPVRHHMPPQSIYTYRFRKQTAEASSWVSKKLLRVELSMDMLQLKFFLWLHKHQLIEHAARTVPDPYAAMMQQHPASLERAFYRKKADFDRLLHTHNDESGVFHFSRSPGDVSLCQYVQDLHGRHREAQHELQREIDALLSAGARDCGATSPDEECHRLTKVFCRLSMSAVPPNIDVFNTLIHRLRKSGRTTLTDNIISAVLNSKLRPNEVTLASILSHYTDTNNAQRFSDWVLLIRGERGGLMEAAPWLVRAPWFGKSNADLGRIVEREDKPGRLIQLPYPNPLVFNAVVKGVLHFGGFGHALEICKAMIDQGWGLDIRGFGMLLNDCAVRSDWDSGLAIWNQILGLQKKSARRVDGLKPKEIIMAPLFADMLRLCRRCDKRQAFVDVWDQAKKTHPTAVRHITEMIKVDSVSDRVRRSQQSREEATPDHANGSRHAVQTAPQSQQAALEALSELRAQQSNTPSDANSQQEYLALQADIEFLKVLGDTGEPEKPKARSLSELARSAYNLIALPSGTLERRASPHHREQFPMSHDKERPVSYTELVKNAYHLVADHPSTLERRTLFSGIPTADFQRSRHVDEDDGQDAHLRSREQELDESMATSSDSTPLEYDPTTYSFLAKNADVGHPRTLDPPKLVKMRTHYEIRKIYTDTIPPFEEPERDQQSSSDDNAQTEPPKNNR
ncbi:hypothetical protein CERZMDRAFT_107315 [Cercospora zeae-maydis SCOH1-5]|uniref:Pentatricopeptide repeat protein n=1 Tax=Cercospora zeae-maydis SCOH1-5 TaxID=717836 RepID=A0A6A6F6X8_9PEZI|nr:hypothetical protein CERZMDRAFT_107315 [Cercospora zeae-maydis SCOH1-5]